MQGGAAEQGAVVLSTCTGDGGYIGLKLALCPKSFKDMLSYPIVSNHISRLLSDLKKKKVILNILLPRGAQHYS